MCKVPLNPSSQHPSEKVNLSPYQPTPGPKIRPSHPSHWPQCRNGQNSPGLQQVTGVGSNHSQTSAVWLLDVIGVSIFRHANQKKYTRLRPSPNNDLQRNTDP